MAKKFANVLELSEAFKMEVHPIGSLKKKLQKMKFARWCVRIVSHTTENLKKIQFLLDPTPISPLNSHFS